MNNLKGIKQKPANSQTPKKSETSVQLDRYFSRPNSIRNYTLKENINPNLNFEKQRKKQKQKDYPNNGSPKKKVIHLKSISKNSKSVKDKGSGSVDRNLKSEQNCTQVGDFSDKFDQSISPIKIDIDLKSHRKSMQDTLVSSNQLYEKLNKQNIPNCDEHLQKPATFIIKGRPFCDKCSVKFITKGYVGVKIRNELGPDIYQQVAERSGKKQVKIRKQKENRNTELRQFIGKVDRTQQLFDQLILNIQEINKSISKQMEQEVDKFWNAWRKLMEFLDKFKTSFLSKFQRMEQKIYEQLSSIDQNLQEKVSSLKFMRNDIVRNVDKIIEIEAVPDSEYRAVMLNFEEQLRVMQKQSQVLRKNILLLPKIQFGLYKIEEQINSSIHIVSTPQQLMGFEEYEKNNENQNSDTGMQNYRISFGREIQKASSPTFKIF